MSPPENRTPATSPNIVDNVHDDNQIWIVPGGGSKFELARPSWKNFPESTREVWPDTSTPILETVRSMNYVIDKGWAFYWVTSEWSAQQITEAWGVAQRLDLVSPIVVQPEYNLLSRHKKKGKVKGLGSLGRSVKATNNSTLTLPKEIDEMIKSHVDDSNADLYAQLLNERNKNKRIRKELDLLMKHVYKKSSSNDERQSQENN
ncbi:hypothetical protein T459_17028 [Capsicum annuum]|uniref:NADP-dependent oxidoreductase domain-containing protein n=1 Tax=Capsicum annuum TaxID=4072 RepID=A0A2G2ZAE2_CAPAN|nr:hypothetical protein T459_17028 [Capsicum annuum]